MTKRWLKERKKDHYYKKAKRQEYRSRAAYKLFQINNKFNIIKENNIIIDLGASPGGWSQVAAETVGESGKVIAVDIKPMKPIKGVDFIRGNALEQKTQVQIEDLLTYKKADAIVSDMSPNISGNYSLDHAKSIELAETTLVYADLFLKRGGNILVKVFDGDMSQSLFNRIKIKFRLSKRHAPKASRKSSSEIYMIGKGFKG
jgi:23S rRNA (uridine2552-2'-O)-methyltransferase